MKVDRNFFMLDTILDYVRERKEERERKKEMNKDINMYQKTNKGGK